MTNDDTPRSLWIVRYCSTPGCGVRIRELVTNQTTDACKWCKQGVELTKGQGWRMTA